MRVRRACLLPASALRRRGSFVVRRNERVRKARPNTKLICVETPSNPLMRLTDLRAVAEVARSRAILTLADNTFATPINQRPLELGIDLVMHSGTKYMGGHSDLSAGAVAGATSWLEKIWDTSLVLGSVLGPFDGWLLLRGLRTLPQGRAITGRPKRSPDF